MGIAHDSTSNKLYWCSSSPGEIFRSHIDGTEVETLLSTTECKYISIQLAQLLIMHPIYCVYFCVTSISDGSLYDLAVDTITGNVYVATFDGYILACGDGATRTFNCFTILSDQNAAAGITLDPAKG